MEFVQNKKDIVVPFSSLVKGQYFMAKSGKVFGCKMDEMSYFYVNDGRVVTDNNGMGDMPVIPIQITEVKYEI